MGHSSVVAVLEASERSHSLTDTVAELVQQEPVLFDELMFGLWHVEGAIRSKAADAVEKATRQHPELLQPFKAELLGLMPEARPAAVRWHLAKLVARLKLSRDERDRAVELLRGYLTDRSIIVRVDALESLVRLAPAEAEESVQNFIRKGTPAMKARGRILLKQLGGTHPAFEDRS